MSDTKKNNTRRSPGRRNARARDDTHPLGRFHNRIRTPATKKIYVYILERILCEDFEDCLHGTFEQRAKELVERAADDPDWIEDKVFGLAASLNQRTRPGKDNPNPISPRTTRVYRSALKKLLDSNRITFPWKDLDHSLPQIRRINGNDGTRGWMRKEMEKMLRHTRSAKHYALTLVLASSGMRVGGTDFKWRDVRAIYETDAAAVAQEGMPKYNFEQGKLVCACIRVYAGESEEYDAMITPEAYDALMSYKTEWEYKAGRRLTDDDYVFNRPNYPDKPIDPDSVRKRFYDTIRRAGIRPPKVRTRREVPAVHGFRKYFNQALYNVPGTSDGSSIMKKYLMGHAGNEATDGSYYKVTTLQLAEEYVKAIPYLTITESWRIKAGYDADAGKNRAREQEMGLDIAQLKKMVRDLSDRLEEEVDKKQKPPNGGQQ